MGLKAIARVCDSSESVFLRGRSIAWRFIVALPIILTPIPSCVSPHITHRCHLTIRYKNGESVAERNVRLVYPGGEKRAGDLKPGQSVKWRLTVPCDSKVNIVYGKAGGAARGQPIELPTSLIGSVDYDITNTDEKLLQSIRGR